MTCPRISHLRFLYSLSYDIRKYFNNVALSFKDSVWLFGWRNAQHWFCEILFVSKVAYFLCSSSTELLLSTKQKMKYR